MPPRASRSPAGFTLMEVVVVLAVIGMVMMLVMPRLPAPERENLKASARTLAASLRYVQERAAASRTEYYLTLAPGTESAKFFEVGADGGGKEPADPLLQKAVLKEGIQVADVVVPRLGKVMDGHLRLDVGMGGLREFTAIHLRSSSGTFWTVMAFPSGGKVTLHEGYQEEPR